MEGVLRTINIFAPEKHLNKITLKLKKLHLRFYGAFIALSILTGVAYKFKMKIRFARRSMKVWRSSSSRRTRTEFSIDNFDRR